MNLSEFVKTVYSAARIECGDRALRQVASAAAQVEKQLGRSVGVGELSEDMICRHLRWMWEKGDSPDYVNRRRGHLLTMWKVAYKRGLNSHDFWRADIPRMQARRLRPSAWSIQQIQLMLLQAEKVELQQFGQGCWRALILMIYYTGLRISAVLELRRADLHGRLLIVPDGIQKERDERCFRLPNNLVNLLISLPRPQEIRHGRNIWEMLLPWPWRFDRVQDKFARYILRPAGLPADNRRLKFHAIRRTVATIIAIKKGKEAAMDVLGHSSMKVTERYLADPETVDPEFGQSLNPIDVLPPLGDAG